MYFVSSRLYERRKISLLFSFAQFRARAISKVLANLFLPPRCCALLFSLPSMVLAACLPIMHDITNGLSDVFSTAEVTQDF
jgi:hypothetical protein